MTMEKLDINKNSHILWIDGVKGLSCIFIFLHHFFLKVYPASYLGASRESKLFDIDIFLSQNTLGFFLNGNFFVFLYIFISGYVITHQIIRKNPKDFGLFHFKRYLKLSFPLAVYSVIFFITYLINKDLLSEILQDRKCNLFITIKNALYRIIFYGDTNYGGHFWMMNYIFLGGLLVSILASFNWKIKTKITFYISLFLIFIFFLNWSFYYIAAFLPCSLYLYQLLRSDKQINESHKKSNLIFLVLFGLSIFLGAYPTGYSPDNYYRFITFPIKSDFSYRVYHLIAAFFFFVSVSKLDILKRFFESKLCVKLAKISYSFYIFHGLVQLILFPILTFFANLLNNYILASLIYLLVSLLFNIFISDLFTKYLFTPFGKFVNAKTSKWMVTDEIVKQ